ncbi:phosphoribosylformylglycinamidine (FGAM) synthase PurS component [Pantoea sp. AN62]|uniref:hypothetical protein n=1 Tax=unclassified Pantoea TaxID=2630326 RepID=UPI00117F6BA7|nr:hypothetical protein [Pantoea sp. AV62]
MTLTLSQLAVPQVVRRKRSGRYSMRLREVGKTSLIITISLKTTDRRIAMERMRELAATAKAFMLDKIEASQEELRAHLKDMAERLLTEPVGSFWDGLSVSVLEDAKADLKELSVIGRLTIDQHRHLQESLRVIEAAQSRVHGDASGLLKEVCGSEYLIRATNSDSVETPEGYVKAVHQHEPEANGLHIPALEWSSLSATYRNEHMVNLKPASQADIVSAHKTLNRFTGSINWNTHSRGEVTAMRDSMIDLPPGLDTTLT